VTDDDLVRLLVLEARDLEARGYAGAGLLRQAARRLVELRGSTSLDSDMGRCVACGGPIEQPPTGRRRIRCADCAPVRRKLAQTRS
jgi:hypothetical protein